jgi:hypothetical protein
VNAFENILDNVSFKAPCQNPERSRFFSLPCTVEEPILSSNFKSHHPSLDCSTDSQSNAFSDADDDVTICISDFDIKCVVGDGGYSKVYLGTHCMSSEEELAIKVMNKRSLEKKHVVDSTIVENKILS